MSKHSPGTIVLAGAGAERWPCRRVLEQGGHRVLPANDEGALQALLEHEAVALVCAKGTQGLGLLGRCRQRAPAAPRALLVSGDRLAAALGSGEPRALDVHVVAAGLPPSALLAALEGTMAAARRQRTPDPAAGDGGSKLTDPLTGLPSRLLMLDRLTHAITRAARRGDEVAFILLGVDRFKLVNAALGQRGGDQLLRAVAERLAAQTRDSDSLGRASGDEFGMVISPLRSAAQAARVAHRVLEALQAPVWVQGHEVFPSASLGIAISPTDGDCAEALIHVADAALQRAKQQGRGRFHFYSAADNSTVHERLALEGELRRALEREEFEIFYQVQVGAADGDGTGFESLLRWRHPERGLISPAQFIPVLEDTGLIAPVGRWVLEQACRTLARWRGGPFGNYRLSVNLSPKQFALSDLVGDVDSAIGAADLADRVHLLELEITESLMLSDREHSVATLEALRKRGISIAMDDFGTGYSSLSYLISLPLDVLKIDRAFICEIGQAERSDALVSAIIAMARSLNLAVVAEGVETAEQWRFLQRHGIEKLQGYLFGKPVPETELRHEHRYAAPIIETGIGTRTGTG